MPLCSDYSRLESEEFIRDKFYKEVRSMIPSFIGALAVISCIR